MRSRLIRVLLAVVIVTCGGDCADTPPSGTPTPIPEQTATATPTAEPDAPVAFGENVFVAVRSETSLDAPLDPANYGVSLYAGDERANPRRTSGAWCSSRPQPERRRRPRTTPRRQSVGPTYLTAPDSTPWWSAGWSAGRSSSAAHSWQPSCSGGSRGYRRCAVAVRSRQRVGNVEDIIPCCGE